MIPQITAQNTFVGITDHKVNYHLINIYYFYLNIIFTKLEKTDH